MCTDLQDIRVKVTGVTHSVLTAKAEATGKDMSEIVREILAQWADEEVHAASVMARLLRGKGLIGEDGRRVAGTRGNGRE